MKAIRIISRSIRDSIKSVFRNFSLSIASISCITITLIVVAISMVLSYNSVMEDYTREDSPLQDTFQLKVIDIDNISDTADQISEIEGVDLVKYGEEVVEKLVQVFDVIRKGCIYIVVALIIVTAFLIGNTIKITIFSRKKEIEIMRLVGASNINIKIPFILEGLLLGLLGSLIPVIITIFGYNDLYNHFGGVIFSKFIKLVKPDPFVYLVCGVLIGIGMIVGMLGSARAVRKYLKI